MQWNPWHGCHKCSPGCMNCYVYYLDKIHGREADVVTRSKTAFYLPVKKTRQGGFKIPPGTELATCFTSDFFIEEADLKKMLNLMFITKTMILNFQILIRPFVNIMIQFYMIVKLDIQIYLNYYYHQQMQTQCLWKLMLLVHLR